MSLHLILGDKKSGKTTLILDGVKNSKNCTLIVPEQTLFKYESLILDKLGEESSFLVNTLSFKKLAVSLIKNEEKYNEIKLLDNDTRSLIVEKILIENRDNFTAFSRSARNPEFAEKIAAQITEFKRYLISCDYLSDMSKKDTVSKSLREKLNDLSIIYKEYEKRIDKLFKDADDIITFGAKKILNEKLYKGQTIYIDGFTGFTKDELYMIEAFLLNGAEVYIALLYDEKRGKNPGSLFYSVEKTINKLEKLCERTSVKQEKILLSGDFIKSQEIKFLKENYENTDSLYHDEVKDIKIYKCKNTYNECVNLVSDIIGNIKNEKAALSDIAVIVPDMKSYLRYLKDVFSSFDISYYCNEKVSVYDMSVAMLISNLFEIIESSNKMEVILAYLKSGYFLKDEQDKIFKFENFISETGIRAYTLLGKPISDIIAEKKLYNFQIENEEALKEVYDLVILPVVNLKERLKRETTANGYSCCIYEFLKEIKLEDMISVYADDYEAEGDLIKGEQLIQVYNYIVESMERASVILGDISIGFSEYKDIILSGLKTKNIASIPILNDSITICDLAGFCDNSYKYIYILGANEGKIPDTSFKEGIINENEREELASLGMEMSMNYELKITENYLKLYDALLSGEKGLYISCPVFDKSGEELAKAEFISDIATIFGIDMTFASEDIISKRELLSKTLSEISKTGEISDSYKYLIKDEEFSGFLKEIMKDFGKETVKDVKVSSGKLNKLLKSKLNLSVTNIEKYRKCAFSYFLRYVLKADEKGEFQINPVNIGSLLHLILEMFSSELKEDNTEFSDIDGKYISDKLDRIIKKAVRNIDNGVFMTDVRSSYFIKRIKRMAEYAINLLKLHFIKGSFRPVEYEYEFGRRGSKNEGLTFDLGDGRKIVLNGVIDRVDQLTSDDGEYIRIVDYKSSGRGIDFYEIFSGINIQLAVYLLTMLNDKTIGNIKPGGMLYLSLDTPIIKIANPLDTDELELRIRKEHIMTGIFLNSPEVLNAMDSELQEQNQSEIIDVKFDKNGLLNGKNTLSLSEFQYMLSSVTKLIKEEGKSIFNGEFKINPVLSGRTCACTYCPYGSVCMFEDGLSGYNVIEKLSKEELFSRMGGEENE